MVRSSIFLGDLGLNAPGGNSIDVVHVDMPLTADDFGAIADTHSATTLLGLALDARAAGLPGEYYAAVASRALEHLLTVENSQGADAQLEKLKCAVLAVIAAGRNVPIPECR